MIILQRHVSEQLLGAIADGSRPGSVLGSAAQRHLDGCDRCSRLLAGHRRAAALLAAPWSLVPASQLVSAGIAPTAPTRPVIRAGSAIGRTSARWVPIAALLMLASIVGLLIILAGARHRSPGSDPFAEVVWLQWAPDGRHLAYEVLTRAVSGIPSATPVASAGPELRQKHAELWVVDADGGNRHLVARIPANAAGSALTEVSWSGDGAKLAYIAAAVIVIDAIDGTSSTTVHGLAGGQLSNLSWAPGPVDALAFEESTPTAGDVLVADSSGAVHRVTSSNAAYVDSWSPDGRLLLYEDDVLGGTQGSAAAMWVVRADGRGARRLGPCCGDGWSPDSGTVYGWEGPDTPVMAYSLTAGAVPAPLLPADSAGWLMAPDGHRWATVSDDGRLEVQVPGGPLQEISANRADSPLAWSPDGTALAVDRASTSGHAADAGLYVWRGPDVRPLALVSNTALTFGGWRQGTASPLELAYVEDRAIKVTDVATSRVRTLVPRSVIAGDPLEGDDPSNRDGVITIGPDGPTADIVHLPASGTIVVRNDTDAVWRVELEGWGIDRGMCPQGIADNGGIELAGFHPPDVPGSARLATPPDYCNVAPGSELALPRPLAGNVGTIGLVPTSLSGLLADVIVVEIGP
jgi:hypothetical protein